MAYEPTNWKSGDVVTSAKLNKLEKGVEDAGPLIIDYNGDTFPSFNDIIGAVRSGKTIMCVDSADEEYTTVYYLTGSTIDGEDLYRVGFTSHLYGEEGFSSFYLVSATKTDPMTVA